MEQQLLQEQKKPNALAFKVAILYAIYFLAYTVVLRILKVDPQAKDASMVLVIGTSVLAWGVFIIAIVYAQITHKKELGGFMTFGRAFSTGFKVAAYSGLFMALLLVLYYEVIDPAAVTQMIETATANAKTEQQAQGIEMMGKYMGLFGAFGAGVTFSIAGLIVSLISGAVIKNDRPLHFEEAE